MNYMDKEYITGACLCPTDVIDSNNPVIIELAGEITERAAGEAEAASLLFYYTRDSIRYNPYSPFHAREDYVASTVIQRGYGYCIQKAVVLAALARAAGIPSRLGFANIRNHQLPEKMLELQGTDIIYDHGFTELFLGGEWLKATPAFNRGMCDMLGLVPVEFDGRSHGVFSRNDIHGNISIEYLDEVGSWPDLPLDHILGAFERIFGPERFKQIICMIEEHGHAGAMSMVGVDI